MTYKFCILGMFFCFFFSLKGVPSAQICQITTQELLSPIQILSTPANLYLNTQPYENGGLTIYFPENLFTVTPTVRASIEWDRYTTDTLYTAFVTSRSKDSATIRINALDTGSLRIREADTNEVQVAIFAYGK